MLLEARSLELAPSPTASSRRSEADGFVHELCPNQLELVTASAPPRPAHPPSWPRPDDGPAHPVAQFSGDPPTSYPSGAKLDRVREVARRFAFDPIRLEW